MTYVVIKNHRNVTTACVAHDNDVGLVFHWADTRQFDYINDLQGPVSQKT